MRAHSNISLSLEMALDALQEAFIRAGGGTLSAFAGRVLPLPGRITAPPAALPWYSPKLILAPLNLFTGRQWSVEMPVPRTQPELDAISGFGRSVATAVRNAARDNCLPCVWSKVMGQAKPRKRYYGSFRSREVQY